MSYTESQSRLSGLIFRPVFHFHSCPSKGLASQCFGAFSMLLVTALFLGIVIKTSSSETNENSDLFEDVFVCVGKDKDKNGTIVTWTVAAYIRVKCCDLVYTEQKTLVSIQNQPPAGTFQLPNFKQSSRVLIQMTCFVTSCGESNDPNPSGKIYKSSHVWFMPGPNISKVCSKNHPSNLTQGQISVCIQPTQGKFNHVVQWWSSQSYGPTSCALHYTALNNAVSVIETQHRTETFRDLPMNSSMFLTEGATDIEVECNDSNNERHTSGILKFTAKDSMQRICLTGQPSDHTLPITAGFPRLPSSKSTKFTGLRVSSLAQGLVLAFGIMFVVVAVTVVAYKRYRSYLRRWSQRLLRAETAEEENEEAAMQEFQRMV